LAINYSFGLPLKNNFVEFAYYQGLFLPHEINKILEFWDDDKTFKAEVSGEELHKDELRKSSVMGIDNEPENGWLYQKLASIAVAANNERYWFDLLGFHEKLQLAHYGEGDFFDWHLDFGPGVNSARKLSISIQLSDSEEYEGGDLQFMVNQNIISAPRTKGTVVIFPSFIIHRVTPITKGTRQSIVGWVTGPPFR